MIPADESGKILLSYDDLLICEEEGVEEFFVPDLRKSVNVKELLDGIDPDDKRKDQGKSVKQLKLRKITLEEMTKLAEDLVDNFFSQDDANNYLGQISVNSGKINKGENDLSYFKNVIRHLYQVRKIREWLLALEKDDMFIAKEWLDRLKR